MIHADKVPLKPFDESACLKYLTDSEPLVDQQLAAPWGLGEYQRLIQVPVPADFRYYVRLKQFYESAKWIISDPFQNILTGGYFATFARPTSQTH